MRLGFDELLAIVGATIALAYKKRKKGLAIASFSIGYLIGKKVRV